MIWKLQEFGGIWLILFIGLLEKETHIFTYDTFFVKQITLKELIFVGTNFCEDSDFK